MTTQFDVDRIDRIAELVWSEVHQGEMAQMVEDQVYNCLCDTHAEQKAKAEVEQIAGGLDLLAGVVGDVDWRVLVWLAEMITSRQHERDLTSESLAATVQDAQRDLMNLVGRIEKLEG